jgi:phenylacetate-coenzyme A ligase PaaK-like adenylate-forming protein
MSVTSELLDVLAHARRTSPFYADRIPHDLGSPAEAERLLVSLPLLSRRDIQQHGPRLWSREGASRDWRIVRTTGTTDEPVEVIVDEGSRRAEAAALAAHIDRCLGTPEWRERDVVHLTLHPGASSTALPSPWNGGARVVKWNLVWAWQRSDASFIDSLAHIDGHVVTAMPSVIELLCSRLAAAGGTVAPLLVVLSGQTVDAHIRDAVRQALGCRPTSLYTLAEAGIVGSECETTGGYHVEEPAAVVEIVDEAGRQVRPGIEGELVVTPLQNRAMPLVRYRTGDRATWSDRPCGCGRPVSLFFLVSGRRPSRLVTASGATINVVRFAKLLAGLSVSRIRVDQTEAGGARVSYEAERELGPADRSLLVGALHAALGPEAEVTIRRGDAAGAASELAPPRAHGSRAAEPAGPAPEELARWLRRELRDRPGLEAAVITGSFLDPEAAGAQSDIDLVLLVHGEVADAAWAPLAGRLRRTLPRLRINVADADRLSERSPLLACRLLREHHHVVGRLTQALVRWPSQANLRAAAAFWSDDAEAALWTRLTDPERSCRDPIGEARFASKYALDGLRYLYLASGCRETAARAVLELAAHDPPGCWLADVVEAFDVAREHRPPPEAGSGRSESYLEAALACARHVAARV